MGKSSRAYKSEKRSKELKRQKKKEEKMKRRLAKGTDDPDESAEKFEQEETTIQE